MTFVPLLDYPGSKSYPRTYWLSFVLFGGWFMEGVTLQDKSKDVLQCDASNTARTSRRCTSLLPP
ncbi:hypothetical protein SCLCIDRAFT_1213769 [Scleroderma citrinum Foug A]|uniref:Uncharacterized protein n=1 Tax=Scleroderma citrinum Foug A TaxID=1036808 RepID=A0A0C3E7G7_9AGAM|nr:hypothetical protein SCLCIDRAFT_1213769 [Scleroderma citrinum Foug A]